MISEDIRSDWLAVGRVNIGGFKSLSLCTGVLISPTEALTAAHCVSDPEDGVAFQPYKVRFVAAWHKGNFAAVGKAKQITIHPEYGARKVGSLAKIEVDLALITLMEPMEGVVPLPVNLSDTPFKEGPVKMFGYRSDRKHIITDYQGCSAYVFRKAMLSIDCDVIRGTSGAPVFGQRGGIWEVVGIVSSSVANQGRDKALAALVGAVKTLRDAKLPTSNP